MSELSEKQKLDLTRNALFVAGQDMGAAGDHWPIINATINNITHDWEELQIERNVHSELKEHLGTLLREMDRALVDCPTNLRPKVESKLKELRALYDAHFTDVDEHKITLQEKDLPDYIKRAEHIIDTLGGKDE